jgi:hypothetical protein
MIEIPDIMDKKKYGGMSSNAQEEYIGKKIIEFLDLNSNGVAVPDIAENSPFSTQTIIKHLERFVSSGLAYKIRRRNLTTYYKNGKPDHPEVSFDQETSSGGLLKAKILNNNFGRFVYFEYKTSIMNGGILLAVNDVDSFESLLNKIKKEI